MQTVKIRDETVANITKSLPSESNPTYSDCTWHVRTQTRNILQIQFILFHLEGNQEFLYLSTEQNSLDTGFRLTGTDAPRVVFSFKKEFWVHFMNVGDVPSQARFWIQISLHNMGKYGMI